MDSGQAAKPPLAVLGQPEAIVIVLGIRIVPIAIGNAIVLGIVVPRPAAKNPKRGRLRFRSFNYSKIKKIEALRAYKEKKE